MTDMMGKVAIGDLMKSSGVAFGTSGARGLVTAMTDRVCFAYVCGFLQHMAAEGMFAPGGAVAIAGDLRPSSPRIAAACAAAVEHMGGAVLWCGFVPSPAVAAYGFDRRIPSLMVTGSHIPDDRNGIKFNRADGEILKPDEQVITAQTVDLPVHLFDAAGMLASPALLGDPVDAATPYAARYTDFFEADALKGLTLGVYQHSAVGRDVLAAIARSLGADVVLLGRSERFIPVDTEAVRPEDVALARQWSADHGLDAILSTDGDSDRPLLADETGRWIGGDVLGILASRQIGATHVATPVTSNTALEATAWFKDVRRTRIGSPFVIAGMQDLLGEGRIVVGYEANGGLLLGSKVTAGDRTLPALPTRDAVLPMLAALVAAQQQGKSLSGLVAQLPARVTVSDRLTNFPVEISRALLERLNGQAYSEAIENFRSFFEGISGDIVSIDRTDGLRATNVNGDIIHIRPSGNAPELRCYVESVTVERASTLSRAAMKRVTDWHLSLTN